MHELKQYHDLIHSSSGFPLPVVYAALTLLTLGLDTGNIFQFKNKTNNELILPRSTILIQLVPVCHRPSFYPEMLFKSSSL